MSAGVSRAFRCGQAALELAMLLMVGALRICSVSSHPPTPSCVSLWVAGMLKLPLECAGGSIAAVHTHH